MRILQRTPQFRAIGFSGIFLLAISLVVTTPGIGIPSSDPVVQAASPTVEQPVWKHAAVAADHPQASEAGVEMLRQGGNVVDAAVAVGFALSVLRPASSGMGGGGFMVIWDSKKQQSIALDYRERAPLAATRDMYLEGDSEASRRGALAVAVPGHVLGLCHALKKYGSLPLSTVLKPAIRFAKDGVTLDEHELTGRKAAIRSVRKSSDRFAGLWNGYLASGNPVSNEADGAASRWRSPQLPALELLARDGVDAFYRGPIAVSIVDHLKSRGGILTLEDFQQMDVVERRPLTAGFDDMQIIAMPPPSSGGVAIVESLNILTWLEQHKLGGRLETLGHNSPKYLHVLAEALKHSFADRATWLGDPDFVDIPVSRLTSPGYAAKLGQRIELNKTRPLKDYGRYLPINDSGTSHFSIIDAAGNAVACTETINTGFGSWEVEPAFGIVLNNEMDDFAARPGQPNAFGLIQSEASAVGPRRKPLSSMSPTILVRDGKAVFVAGASGGPRIISSTLQVLLNMIRFGMSPGEAISKPRIHHQWLPETLLLESPLDMTVADELQSFGHKTAKRNQQAVSQAARQTPTGLEAASDTRKHGRATGF
ncbi:MAG: gamma-glutamyltransferase [Rhodopirellula sp.]|nr:gamma-glutamyltransferase [Rhodopirellula sp.]